MTARCALDKNHSLLPTERGRPGDALSKGYVLTKIDNYMKTTQKDGCKCCKFSKVVECRALWGEPDLVMPSLA